MANAIGNIARRLEPLDARSVILSALLGSHPPVLPVRALVALAECFDMRAGTIRTSLSRMVANGELEVDDGRYRLTERLLARQREQDSGRTTPSGGWDGRWIIAVAESNQRTVAERRRFRSAMRGARLAELRPDTWMRPANLPAPTGAADVMWTLGDLHVDDVDALVQRLWPLDELDAEARQLRDALVLQRPVIDRGDDATLAATFELSAAVVKFLRTEPQLPQELTPATWTPPELRAVYDDVALAFSQQLRNFFADNSRSHS